MVQKTQILMCRKLHQLKNTRNQYLYDHTENKFFPLTASVTFISLAATQASFVLLKR